MINRTAIFSDCNQYRYLLTRQFHTELFSNSVHKSIAFLMFNPSTADANEDDPTIRRVMGFARREKCTIVDIINLIPFITPYPSDLDPNTAFGDRQYITYLLSTLLEHNKVVIGWGAIGDKYPDIFSAALFEITQYMQTEALLASKFFCLGKTETGHPKHPLYIKKDQPLEPFDLHQYLKKHTL